jgi:hypothetical protein
MRVINGRALLGLLVGLGLPVTPLAVDGKTGPARLTAAQVVEKHLAARGGLKAWHAVQTMVSNGKMDVGSGDSVARSERYVRSATAKKNKGPRTPPPVEAKDEAQKQVQVPFLLEMKRPAKSRIEIEFAGKTAVQVYDGTAGWLLRPYLNRDDWEPFSPEQARSQQGHWELGGPLIDQAAQGGKVELVSVEPVEGHDAYKLKLTRKGGETRHVWIDTKSFLDVKVEGVPRRLDGTMRTVWVTQRDFRPVQGLMVPFVLETAVDGNTGTHKMVIEKLALNPRLDDARFAKPRT